MMAACLAGQGVGGEPKRKLERFSYTEYHMGVDARMVVYAPDKAAAEAACTAAFERVAQLDSIMSDYQINSELMRLCRKAGQGPVHVSPDLFTILQESLAISRQSQGLMDVTVGPLVRLWRKARKSHVLPTSHEIRMARKLVGWRKVKLNVKDQTVSLAVRGMQIDLGAIGKGYADDAAQTVLKQHGIMQALVEMGGDIVVSGPPAGADGWTIEVPNATDKHGAPILRFANCAISSSGDTEQFVIISGKRFSHVINPRTGLALTTRVQATLIAPEGWMSDGLSTAVTLLSNRARARLLSHYPGVKCYVRKFNIRGRR